jgi:predicted metal-dependent phosphoesterase TrpH
MLRVEFHCHTLYSKDSLTTPETVLAACLRKGIDRLVITDHNTIAGALKARVLAPEQVIVGEEIMTTRGEILAAFVKEEIPAGLDPLEVIERLRLQGAFISVSHPFDRLRSGAWSLPDLLDIAPRIDAIETFNARCMLPDANRQAQAFAQEHALPGTAGSDAHTAFEIGIATLLIPEFQDAAGLKRVIGEARFRVRPSPPWVHLASHYARWVKEKNR